MFVKAMKLSWCSTWCLGGYDLLRFYKSVTYSFYFLSFFMHCKESVTRCAITLFLTISGLFWLVYILVRHTVQYIAIMLPSSPVFTSWYPLLQITIFFLLQLTADKVHSSEPSRWKANRLKIWISSSQSPNFLARIDTSSASILIWTTNRNTSWMLHEVVPKW